MAHFELFKDKAGEHRFRLRADNGEVVCQSEAYDSEAGAKRGTVDLVGVVLRAKDVAIIQADQGG